MTSQDIAKHQERVEQAIAGRGVVGDTIRHQVAGQDELVMAIWEVAYQLAKRNELFGD